MQTELKNKPTYKKSEKWQFRHTWSKFWRRTAEINVWTRNILFREGILIKMLGFALQHILGFHSTNSANSKQKLSFSGTFETQYPIWKSKSARVCGSVARASLSERCVIKCVIQIASVCKIWRRCVAFFVRKNSFPLSWSIFAALQ